MMILVLYGLVLFASSLLASADILPPEVKDWRQRPVVWYAPFLAGGGYSSEALNFVLELRHHLPRLGIVQFAEHASRTFLEGLPPDMTAEIQRMMLHGRRVPPAITICHSTPDVWVPGAFGWDRVAPCPAPNSLYTIGRTMYETDRVPISWVARLNRMDEVWVPTDFHVETFVRSGVLRERLFIVPEAVDTQFFNPHETQAMEIPEASGLFTFLSVFKWEARKNWKGLLRAYFREFGPNDNVILILKTSEFHNDRPITADIDDYVAQLGIDRSSLPPYYILSRHLLHSRLPSLYAAADAFVLPSRGEGWGRPHAEAMAMALPVIATNWSGNAAFMNSRNSLPVPIDGLVERTPGDAEGHRWAQPSVSALQNAMRWCMEHPGKAAALGKVARHDMQAYYSPEKVAAVVLRRLADIGTKLSSHGEL